MESARLVVIDNYDSFTHNLVQMFVLYDLAISVFRADTVGIDRISAISPDYLLISPGPKNPEAAGISVDLICALAGKVPILGVCLGMQCINEAFGGATVRAHSPVHGKTSRVFHDNTGVFAGMADPFVAARYHSLAVDARGTGLDVNAVSEDGAAMGLCMPTLAVHGVQFHPESFMTAGGFRLVENFLKTGSLAKRLENGGLRIDDEAMAPTRYTARSKQSDDSRQREWM